MITEVLGTSMLSLAQERGLLDVTVTDLRSFTNDQHRTADDRPYGGGAGMLLKPEPILRAVDTIHSTDSTVRFVVTSPRGKQFDQCCARDFSQETRQLVFICGHYEGIDDRVRTIMLNEGHDVLEMSIGDYVLTGGELAALVMIDASVRLISGVLGDEDSTKEESFSSPLLEYAQYTRPAEFRQVRVPDVLLSGNHGNIQAWRHRSSLESTYVRRPDLLRENELTESDKMILSDIQKNENETSSKFPGRF